MKGATIIKEMDKSGNYVSEIDYDPAFVTKDNKKGWFKMLIQPIENEIKYIKCVDGYIVSGEAYIIAEGSEELIDKYIDDYKTIYDDLIFTEVNSKDELF